MSKNEGIQPSSKFCSPSSNPTFSLSYLPFSSQTLTPILSRTQSSVDQFFKSIKWPPNPSFPLRVARNSSQYPVTSNNKGIQFISSSIKVPASKFCNPSSNPPSSLSSLPFGSKTLSCTLSIAQSSVAQFFNSIKWPSSMSKFSSRSPSLLLCSTTMVVTQDGSNTMEVKEKEAPVEYANLPQKEDEERVLISEVLVKNKNGEELQRKDLEAETLTALRVCRPNSALTAREIQEDVHRVIDTGYFSSCMPVAVDTRDGIRLVFQVEPNQEFHGLVCEGATILPSKFLEDAFRGEYGKVVNIRRLDEVINSIDSWYRERGLFGMVSGVAIDSGGTIRMQVAEAEVNDISIRFHDRKTGEPTIGKTKPGTILRHLTTKKGQVYNLIQSKRDVNSVLSMGIMEDVSILPQPAGDTGKVDLVTNVVERASGGFSAGGGISSGIISSPLSGLIGSFAYSHSNLFGRNQKVNISLEKGQIDSIFRMNYTDPWVEGDDKRTSRSIMVQNSRAPGTLVHGNQPNNSNLTIDRVTAGIEFSRPLRPKWSGTTGITFQRACARDDKGDPVIKDFYSSPLTASRKTHDNTLLAKVESVYSGDLGRTMFAISMEQGLPISPEWLHFFRVNSRARTGIALGPASVLLSLSGSHVEGNFSPHEAFPIGGTNSVRGYEEGAVGSGRSSVVGCGELSLPLFSLADGVIFADYGTDLGSGATVPGDPAGARLKPGSGYGYGLGIRFESPLGPLRLEYAFNDRNSGRFHFCVGNRN